MIVIGLWLSNEDNAQSRAIALHDILGSAILEQKERWDASDSEDACKFLLLAYRDIPGYITSYNLWCIIHRAWRAGFGSKALFTMPICLTGLL
ncbi:hypothetical protein BDW71DRAFT_176172 [Aspergillus fruticulosus]